MASTGIQLSYSCINEASNSHTFTQIVSKNMESCTLPCPERRGNRHLGRLSVVNHDSTCRIDFTLPAKWNIETCGIFDGVELALHLSSSTPDDLACAREQSSFPNNSPSCFRLLKPCCYCVRPSRVRGLGLPTRTSITRRTLGRTRRNRQISGFSRMR